MLGEDGKVVRLAEERGQVDSERVDASFPLLADAAFHNAVALHALDFDDNMPTLRSHPSTTLIPAAFAVGEFTGASGRDVLNAYVVGLEVAGKLGLAFGPGHYTRGWHATSSVGVFGSRHRARKPTNRRGK